MNLPEPPAGHLQLVDDVPAAFSDLVAEELSAALTSAGGPANGRAGAGGAGGPFRWRMALSGGATARACYESLAGRRDLDWGVLECFFGDERCVEAGDPDANQQLVREALGDRISRLAAFYPMSCKEPEAYQGLLSSLPGFDLIHLGLGPDGHTASLFAGSTGLVAPPGALVELSADPSATNPHPRMTVTLECIRRASLAVFTVAGESKRSALARVLRGDDLPAARVRAKRVLWLVDGEALGPAGSLL